MPSLVNAGFGIAFVTLAGLALGLQMVVSGRSIAPIAHERWRLAHRSVAWSFLTLYLVMMFIMIRRFPYYYQDGLSPAQALHIALAFALLPLLVIKIAIVRWLPRMSGRLFGLGALIFAVSVVMTAMGLAPYFLRRAGASIAGGPPAAVGERLLRARCTTCHRLERIITSFKSEEEWQTTVERMASFPGSDIGSAEIPLLVNFLAKEQSPQVAEERPTGFLTLTDRKCSKCHSLHTIYRQRKSPRAWGQTVEEMRGRDPDWITESDAELIQRFLAENYALAPDQERQETLASKRRLFVDECSTCHEAARASEGPRRSRGEWDAILRRMKENGWAARDYEVILDYLSTVRGPA